MNEKKEFDAVGDSPGKFVNEGKDANYIKKSNKRQKYVVAAACVLLLLSVIIAVLITGTGNRDSGLVRDVIYPKAYAFDDHDAGMDISEQNPVDDSFLTTLEEFSYNTGSLVLTDKGININYRRCHDTMPRLSQPQVPAAIRELSCSLCWVFLNPGCLKSAVISTEGFAEIMKSES